MDCKPCWSWTEYQKIDICFYCTIHCTRFACAKHCHEDSIGWCRNFLQGSISRRRSIEECRHFRVGSISHERSIDIGGSFRCGEALSERQHRLMPAFPVRKHFAGAKHRRASAFPRRKHFAWAKHRRVSAFLKRKHFAWAKHCHRQHRRTGISIIWRILFDDNVSFFVASVYTDLCDKQRVEKKTRVESLYHYSVAEGEIDR
jgi:hypothetical protein